MTSRNSAGNSSMAARTICRSKSRSSWPPTSICAVSALCSSSSKTTSASSERARWSAVKDVFRTISSMNDHILHDHNPDGIDRRGFLKCMAWAGTGVLWTVSGGILTSKILGATAEAAGRDFTFAQISDSHIGFNKDANKDVIATLQKAIAKVNALPKPPDFILHTGDLSHLSEAGEFDALDQNLKSLKTVNIFYVPGEHDVI